MIDVTRLPSWPSRLEPEGWDDGDKLSFDEWWGRVQQEIGHLGPQVAEQWPYRHWEHSPYAGIPFNELTVRQEVRPTEMILSRVFVSDRDAVDATHDYDVFYLAKGPNWPAQEPGKRMLDQGTWRTPLLVLETPDGLIHAEGVYPEVRFLLIEGHCRHRCLNALEARGEAAEEHQVLILNWG